MKQSGFISWMQTFVIFVQVMIAESAPYVTHCLNPNYLPMFRGIHVGDYCEKVYSSMNCSREPRPSIENDYPLNCEVGRQKDWHYFYHETINKTLKCSVDECQPPELSSLQKEWMRIPSGSRIVHHPTFKLDFLIPKANPERNFYTAVILLSFVSEAGNHKDRSFKEVLRLFEFPSITPTTSDQYRQLQYDKVSSTSDFPETIIPVCLNLKVADKGILLNECELVLCNALEGKYTGAILMTFSSSNDREAGDRDFPTRYRLMNFPDYTYESPDNDRNYQRHLSFSCFIGYQHKSCQSDDYKVYTVTFTAYSKKKTSSNETVFSQLAYDFTIYTYYVYHQTLWKPTIALAKYPRPNDVTVVFDPAPPEYDVSRYEISAVDVIKNIIRKSKTIQKRTNNYRCTFSSLNNGRYYIVVTAIGEKCGSCRNATRSHGFDIGHIQEISRTYASSSIQMMPLFSIISGILLALALVGLLCYCRSRRNRMDNKLKEKPKCLLVYSNREEINCEIAKEFVKCCRNQLQVNVFFYEEEEAILVPDVRAWYKEKFKICSIAIILCFPGSDRKYETINANKPTQDFFNMAVTVALNKKHKDGLKIACVYFDPSHHKSIPKNFRHGVKSFLLMKDLKKLHRYLRGSKNVSMKIVYNTLEIAIDKLKQSSKVNEFKTEDVALYEHPEEETSLSEKPFMSVDLKGAVQPFTQQTCRNESASDKNQVHNANPTIEVREDGSLTKVDTEVQFWKYAIHNERPESMYPKSLIAYERIEEQVNPNRNSNCEIDSDLSSVSSIDIVLPNSDCPIHGFEAWRAKKLTKDRGNREQNSHGNNKSHRMPCHSSSEDDNSEIVQQLLEINSFTCHGNGNEIPNACCDNRKWKHEGDLFNRSHEAVRHHRLQCSPKREPMFETNYEFSSLNGFCRCHSSHSNVNSDSYSHSSDSIDSEKLMNDLSKYI